jgi:hypothetical protein
VTHPNTDKLIGQLRILHNLTNTEAQIATTRVVQARDDSVREELTTNAENAQERSKLIAAALRDLGGVPDVITPALGRATALVKTMVEQVQPLAGALFSDLALEHQLLDRARYLGELADTADHTPTRQLAQRLQEAHQETVEWINSVLAQEAAGEPTAVRPTPVQTAVGRLGKVAYYPARWAAARIDDAAEALARTRSRIDTVSEATVESFSAGRDAGLDKAEQIASNKGARNTATTLHHTRAATGGLTEDELPVKNYDDLTVDEVQATVQKLTDSAALTALLRYEQNNKDRVGATAAIENQLMAQASNSN